MESPIIVDEEDDVAAVVKKPTSVPDEGNKRSEGYLLKELDAAEALLMLASGGDFAHHPVVQTPSTAIIKMEEEEESNSSDESFVTVVAAEEPPHYIQAKWVNAPDFLSKLRLSLVNINFAPGQTELLAPNYFFQVFLTGQHQSVRRIYLFKLLSSVIKFSNEDGASAFWDPVAAKNLDALLVKVCRRWGIEEEVKVIRGLELEPGDVDNTTFWWNAVEAVIRLKKFPLKAKALLEERYPFDEQDWSWEEVMKKWTEEIIYAEEEGDKCQYLITMKQIAQVETAFNNGLLDLEELGLLVRGVKRDCHVVEGVEDEEMSEKITTLKETGQDLIAVVEKFGDFLKENESFERNKTELLVFHAEEVGQTLKSVLNKHADFLVQLSAIRTEEEEVDGDHRY